MKGMVNMDHINISDFQVSRAISGIYRISNIQIKRARNGNTYLKAVLFDATGSINIIFWEYNDSGVAPSSELVSVVGTVGTYMGSPQFTAQSFRLFSAADCQALELSGLVPCAPINVKTYEIRLINLIKSISDTDIASICKQLFREHWSTFLSIPAAQIKHHAFLHGLLMHTVDTAELADAAARKRPGVNRDLLVAGALLHDIGKIYEFDCSKYTGLVTGYTEKGQLLGHAAIGFEMIGRAALVTGANPHIANQLQHLVLSHHIPLATPASYVDPMVELELLRKLDATDSGCERCLETGRRRLPNTTLTTSNEQSASRPEADTYSLFSVSEGDEAHNGSSPQGNTADPVFPWDTNVFSECVDPMYENGYEDNDIQWY